jgi:hypothetical protein
MLKLISFNSFLIEGTKLVPGELKKSATGGPFAGTPRTEILANKVRKQEPLTLAKGGEFIVIDVQAALASIEQFEKDGKAFKLIGKNDTQISSSDLLKTKEFGGGAGAGGGTKQTAIGESAQCVWMAAMLEIGHAMPIESFTDEVLTKASKKASVGKTTLKEMLAIDDSWKMSSYLTAQYAIKNNIIERGMTFHRDDGLMKAIYAAKNKAFKNNDMRPLKDDKWNPGDIWVADADFKMKELNTATVEGLNDDILDLYLQKRLVGISLKKVAKGVTSTEKNVERPPETEDYVYTSSEIKSRVRGEWYTNKGVSILFKGGQLNLRANSAYGSHKAEIKGKGARGGGISWGPMTDASKRIYGKDLPKNSVMKKEAQNIAKGNKSAIKNFTKLLQNVDKKISEDEVKKEISNLGSEKEAAVWIHGKLGGLYVIEKVIKGGQKANKFITQIINYAGSSTSVSSAYIKLSEK